MAKAPAKRTDRRGTPKGKGIAKGGPGATSSGKKRKGRIGNPPHKPTDENRIRVDAMVTAGAQQWLIAEELGLSEDTLQRHYRSQLEHGSHRALSKIGSSMIKRALDGDHDAAKFVLARRAGWKTGTELSGPDGGPIEYRNLSDDELDARITAITGNAAAAAQD